MRNDPTVDSSTLGALKRILHNIQDHTKVIHELVTNGGLPVELRRQLLVHIQHEEAENRRQLKEIKDRPGIPSYEVETLIQHSELVSEFAKDGDANPLLVGEILHHFGEEHEWFSELLAAHSPHDHSPETVPSKPVLTVGSLIGL